MIKSRTKPAEAFRRFFRTRKLEPAITAVKTRGLGGLYEGLSAVSILSRGEFYLHRVTCLTARKRAVTVLMTAYRHRKAVIAGLLRPMLAAKAFGGASSTSADGVPNNKAAGFRANFSEF